MPNPDMSAIVEALRRRSQGSPMGPTTMPVGSQISYPTASTPGGGPNTPTQAPVQRRTPSASQIPNVSREVSSGAKQAAQGAQSPVFDEDTRKLGKALIKKLLEVM